MTVTTRGLLPRRRNAAGYVRGIARGIPRGLLCTAFGALGLLMGAGPGAVPAWAEPVEPAEPVDEVTVAVAQMEINEELYRSVSVFEKTVRDVVALALKEDADLVVFPEYLNVFLPSMLYSEELARSRTVEGLARRILAGNSRDERLRDLLVESSSWTRAVMDRVYGELAARHGVHILAGTYFAAESDRLTNRSVVYGPDGGVIHEQDKVYLTDFERDLLGLNEGYIRDVDSLTVEGFEVSVTICRDLFFSVWEDIHRETDIWIDLRAEGSPWEQGREDFTRVLPERMSRAGSDYGITAALTGAFLDLFWEGRSVVFEQDRRGHVGTVARARSHRGQEVIVVTLRD